MTDFATLKSKIPPSLLTMYGAFNPDNPVQNASVPAAAPTVGDASVGAPPSAAPTLSGAQPPAGGAPAPYKPQPFTSYNDWLNGQGKSVADAMPEYKMPGFWQNLGRSLAYGVAETGGSLNGHPGLGANQMAASNDRLWRMNESNRMRPGMLSQAYQTQYLNPAREQQQMELASHGAGLQDYEVQQQMRARAAGIYDQARQMVQGNMHPDQARRIATQKASELGVNLDRDELESALTGTAPAPPKFQLGQNGMPEPIIYKGRQYGLTPEQGEPPEVTKAREDALTSHQQLRTEKRQDESAVAGFAASRQGEQISAAINAAQQGEANKTLNEGRSQALKHLGDIRDAQMKNNIVQELGKNPTPTNQTSLIFKALDLDLPEGVHRINDAMIESIKKQGSLSDRAAQALGNWTEGEQFAPEIVSDLMKTANTITNNKIKKANDNLEDVNRVYGYKVAGAGARGRLDEAPEQQPSPAGSGLSGKSGGSAKVSNIHVNPVTKEKIGWDGKQWIPVP